MTDIMQEINYKSDFSLVLRLRDLAGHDIGWPEFDWTADFWTFPRARAFTASCIGGVCTNCLREDDGRIRVVFNGHGLTPGRLRAELTAQILDGSYPDRLRQTVQTAVLDTVLTAGETRGGDEEETIMLPLVQGQQGGSGACGCAPAATEEEVMQAVESLFKNEPDRE
ncbi:MAG: hypothetical protein NC311_09055 [Muribaculaceae bacterium]|nr:hypothetical protein [Muribaculaceae bacterium]